MRYNLSNNNSNSRVPLKITAHDVVTLLKNAVIIIIITIIRIIMTSSRGLMDNK